MAKKEGGGEAEEQKVAPEVEEKGENVFGEDTDAPAEAEKKEEKKKFEAIPEDHPTIVALKSEIEKVGKDKDSMGGNLSAQRDLIKTLEGKVEALMKGGKQEKEGEADVLYKEIKWSKDLTEEEREEMTATEIKQMDMIAEMQTQQNKMYGEMQKKGKDEEGGKVEDLNKTVQAAAKALSKDEDGTEDTDMANQIIESFKAMKFDVTGLSAEEIAKRVAVAASQVPDFKPQKEQGTKKGKTVKKDGDSTDPFGVDKIVEEATRPNSGGYAL